MATRPRVLSLVLLALACRAGPQAGASQTPPPWRLVCHDEFDGAALDTTKWARETGGTGWGNGELEFYTNRVENARLENGFLVIEARLSLPIAG